MLRDELIELAVKYYWQRGEVGPLGSTYVTRGAWTISILSDGELILKKWLKHFKETRTFDIPNLTNLKSVPYAPWIIGPFKEGWFSLKANRFVQ